MENVVDKLKYEIGVLEDRVNAKEAILKCVFSSLESTSRDRQMIHKVLGVTPKDPFVSNYTSLEQRWCVGFGDAICVSFDVMNTSEQYHMQPICHILEAGGLIKCVLLNNEGSNIPLLRSNSSAELLVGFSKSQLFKSKTCSILLEVIRYPSNEISQDADMLAQSIARQTRLPSEARILAISAPLRWYSFENFLSAKEPEMLLLLRCLRVGSYACTMKPKSPSEFADANPDFDCCDFGDWQVFVGHGIMTGLVAVSSTFNQPNGNIDRIYGNNEELLNAFVKRCR
ncbi:hypothetical protein V3C99_001688 [Haemonchus contortus]